MAKGKIIQFPTLEERIAEQSRPAITQVINTIVEDSRRHLWKHHSDIMSIYGDDLVQVWASLMLRYIADVSHEAAIRAIGSDERYFVLRGELIKK
jgi:hypothetical protein